MIIDGYLVEEHGKSYFITWKEMNEMSKEEDIATMPEYLVLFHTLFMVIKGYHTVCTQIETLA